MGTLSQRCHMRLARLSSTQRNDCKKAGEVRFSVCPTTCTNLSRKHTPASYFRSASSHKLTDSIESLDSARGLRHHVRPWRDAAAGDGNRGALLNRLRMCHAQGRGFMQKYRAILFN